MRRLEFQKLFTLVLAIALLISILLSYFAFRSLDFDYMDETHISSFRIWITALSYSVPILAFSLLIIANVIYVSSKNYTYFLITFLYFVGFTLFDYTYLSDTYAKLSGEGKLKDADSSIYSYEGLFIIANAAIWILIDFLLVRILRTRRIKYLRQIARIKSFLQRKS